MKSSLSAHLRWRNRKRVSVDSTYKTCAVGKGVSGLPTQLATPPSERTPADLPASERSRTSSSNAPSFLTEIKSLQWQQQRGCAQLPELLSESANRLPPSSLRN